MLVIRDSGFFMIVRFRGWEFPICDGRAEVSNNFISSNLGDGMEIIGAWGNSEIVFAGNKITKNSGEYSVMVGKGAIKR